MSEQTLHINVRDFLSQGLIHNMSPAESGVYIQLLCIDCREGGISDELISKPSKIARCCNTSGRTFERVWARLQPHFKLDAGKWRSNSQATAKQ